MANPPILDYIQLKGGASINGEVLEKTFTLKTKYGSLKLKKSEIYSIEYANPPYVLVDSVRTSAGGRMEGDVLPAKIRVRVEGGTNVVKIPKSDIVAIMFLTHSAKGLSAGTKKALKKARK